VPIDPIHPERQVLQALISTWRKFADRVRDLPAQTAVIALVALALFYSGWILYLSSIEQYPEGKDVFRNLFNLVRIENAVGLSDASPERVPLSEAFVGPDVRYPPLIYLFAVASRAITPQKYAYFATVGSMIPFAVALLFGIYLLARGVGNRSSALLAVWMLLGSGVMNRHAKEFTQALPMAAMFVLILGVALRTRPFSTTKRAAGFGAIVGIGALAYYGVLVYTLVPVVFALVTELRKRGQGVKPLLPMFGAFTAAALVIAGPYYLHPVTLGMFFSEFARFLTPDAIGGVAAPSFSWVVPVKTLGGYLAYVAQARLPWLLLVAVVLLGKRAFQDRAYWGAIGAATVFPLFFFSIFAGKAEEYVVPLVPLLVLVTALCIANLPSKLLPLIAAVAVIGTGADLYSFQHRLHRVDLRTVDGISATIEDGCSESGGLCQIWWANCDGPAADYFLSRERGWSPEFERRYAAPIVANGDEKFSYIVVDPSIAVGEDAESLSMFETVYLRGRACAMEARFSDAQDQQPDLYFFGEKISDSYRLVQSRIHLEPWFPLMLFERVGDASNS
jgi:hypothetical protein